MGSFGSFVFARLIRGRSDGRNAHGLLGPFGRTLGVVGFICVISAQSRALEVVGIIRARPGGPLVHSSSLGSVGRAGRVVGLIRVRWDHSCEL